MDDSENKEGIDFRRNSVELAVREVASFLKRNKHSVSIPSTKGYGSDRDFSERLVRLRRELGLTQKEFAEKYGMDVKSVQNWEQRVRKPDRSTISFLSVIELAPGPIAALMATQHKRK